MPNLYYKALSERATPPKQSYLGDAGFDLFAVESATIPPYETPDDIVDIPTDIEIQLPEGYWGRIVGRSSTIRKRGLLVVEGIIDNGYRGHLFYAIMNPGIRPVRIHAGDRLAQLIVVPLVTPVWHCVTALDESERRERGFGSTGV